MIAEESQSIMWRRMDGKLKEQKEIREQGKEIRKERKKDNKTGQKEGTTPGHISSE